MIYLQLQPDIEAQLSAEAEAYGLGLHGYIEKIIAERHGLQAQRPSAAYQCLMDIAVEVDASEAIKRGLDDLAHGRPRPARQVSEEMN